MKLLVIGMDLSTKERLEMPSNSFLMEIKSRAYEKYSWYSGGIVANCEGA
jgi:hypothetical protein